MTTLDDYAQAEALARQALTTIAQQTAAMASPGVTAAEYLELLRLWLHRRIDDVIDEEALRHPSPHRCIARAARYSELAGVPWV